MSIRHQTTGRILAITAPKHLAMATLLGIGLAATANAAVVVNISSNIAPAGGAVQQVYNPATQGSPTIPVSSTDLAQGLTATVVGGNTTQEQSRGAAAWTDGSISTVYAEGGSGGDAIDHDAYGTITASPGNSQTITFDLGSAFNLTMVNVIQGWNDGGRDVASFTLRASTLGLVYTDIASYTKDDNLYGGAEPVTHLFSIVDNGGADIFSNARFVQLEFTDAQNGFSGLVEVDIIPEPSSALLFGLGAAFLAFGRRRKD